MPAAYDPMEDARWLLQPNVSPHVSATARRLAAWVLAARTPGPEVEAALKAYKYREKCLAEGIDYRRDWFATETLAAYAASLFPAPEADRARD